MSAMVPLTVAGPTEQSTCCCMQEARVGINGPDGTEIAQVLGEGFNTGKPTPAAVTFAEFIVRACNAHEAMLAALRCCNDAFAAWQKVGQIPGRPEDILALIGDVRTAVAKAEGR